MQTRPTNLMCSSTLAARMGAAIPAVMLGAASCWAVFPATAAPAVAESNGAVRVEAGDGAATFTPSFTLLYREQDPQMALRRADLPRVSYSVMTWKAVSDAASGGIRNDDTAVSAGDGLDAETLAGEIDGRTPDYFQAAHVFEYTASSVRRSDGSVTWRLSSDDRSSPLGALVATVDLDATPAPLVRVAGRVHEAGWYSLGYTGATAVDPSAAEEIWQPFIWTERRFPDLSYATESSRCPIPTALADSGDVTVGVAANPEMLPFQPLPTLENSEYAVVLRDAAGQARPMVFAPVLGGAGSKLEAGDTIEFSFYLYATDEDIPVAYESIARDLLGFEDYRENLPDTSLNDTLTNIVEYGLGEYSQFRKDLRGCSYETDVPDAVKNVSSLNPLSLALVTDDLRPFTERYQPIYEFMLSREKRLFNLDPNVRIQSPSQAMHGPCANVSELAAVHAMTGGHDYASLLYAESLVGVDRLGNLDVPVSGDDWRSLLALYDVTGDEALLKKLKGKLGIYMRRRVSETATDFSDPYSGGMFFWTSFTPRWMELYWAYTITGDEELLEAAHAGARRYAMFCWMGPRPPSSDVRVNEDGFAPHYWYLKSKGHDRMRAAETDVPAWWVSEAGLTPESSGTCHGHRGIFMANHAPFMMRIAQDTGDDFLREIARSAVIGRYRNFPGYHMNTARTDVYMQTDYPLRTHKELGYNSFHYNHIWPLASLLVDYLMADVYDASDGAIDFPVRFDEGYAYLRAMLPGDRPGTFYDRDGAMLWMPAGLVESQSSQLDWIAARRDGELLVALTNQSKRAVRTKVKIDAERAGLPAGATQVSLWRDNKPAGTSELRDGEIEIEVGPRGIVAFAIDGCMPDVQFQDRVLTHDDESLGEESHRVIAAGDVRAMLLSAGPDLTNAYIYSRELPGKIERVQLSHRAAGESGWTTENDDRYPFEFAFDVAAATDSVEIKIEVERPGGDVERSEVVTLRR